MAGPRDLPRLDRRTSAISPPDGQDTHPQRLNRVLPPNPRTIWPRQGVDDDAVHLEPRVNVQRAVVTGAASGIGRALATRLAAKGTSLLLIDIDSASLAELADELGAQAATIDVSDAKAMESVAAMAEDA